MYEQFLEGLDSLGTKALVLANESLFEQEFVRKVEALTVEKFIQLFDINLSEEGSNSYAKEIDVLELFYRFLEAVECKCYHNESIYNCMHKADKISEISY